MKNELTKTKRNRKNCRWFLFQEDKIHICVTHDNEDAFCVRVCKFYEPKSIPKVGASNGI